MHTESLTNIYLTSGELYSMILASLGDSINPEAILAIKLNSGLEEITKDGTESALKLKLKNP